MTARHDGWAVIDRPYRTGAVNIYGFFNFRPNLITQSLGSVKLGSTQAHTARGRKFLGGDGFRIRQRLVPILDCHIATAAGTNTQITGFLI